MPLTIEDVERRVANIAHLADRDNEAAHAEEDALARDVLRAIAAGAPDAVQLAKAALQTGAFEFDRWCA